MIKIIVDTRIHLSTIDVGANGNRQEYKGIGQHKFHVTVQDAAGAILAQWVGEKCSEAMEQAYLFATDFGALIDIQVDAGGAN